MGVLEPFNTCSKGTSKKKKIEESVAQIVFQHG